MKEELLTEIRNELESEKNVLEKQNMEIKKIRQFEKDPIVKEYIKLRGLSLDGRKLTKLNIDDSIYRICCQNLYRIREEDTNGIYVYLGTYRAVFWITSSYIKM